MAKVKRMRVKRAKKKVKVRAMRTNRPTSVRKSMTAPMEKSLRDYISLLKDPCNGPLVGPVGANANGYITRFETTIVVNPLQGNWFLRWSPGLLNTATGGTNLNGLYIAEAATMTGVLTTVKDNSGAPGYTFLSNTCQTFRCLAACAQIRYTDTEVNRKGVIGSTIGTSARVLDNVENTFSVTVDRARIPDQALEVLWQPGDGDELFTNMQSSAFDNETLGRKNAIILAGSGCTTGAVSVRLVVVYQWTPGADDKIILPVPAPGTGVTMARVVQLARQAGFVAGHLIRGYSSGGLYGVAREAASLIRPSIRSMR